MSAAVWLVVLAVLGLVVAYDRPCAECGRWLRHTLVCRRRAITARRRSL